MRSVRLKVLCVVAGALVVAMMTSVSVTSAAESRVPVVADQGTCGNWGLLTGTYQVGQQIVYNISAGGGELRATLRWGDGTSSTTKVEGNGRLTHAYTATGSYRPTWSVKVEGFGGECEETVSLGTVRVV